MAAAPDRNTRGTILIVDDNALGLIARKGVLAELGHAIETSSVPEDALALCKQRKFDLIVTDFKMPNMNGIEFIRQLRLANIQVPVILLSGFTDTLGLSEHNTGADAVIQKSANEVGHLIRSVNRLLKSKKPHRKPPGSEGTPGADDKRAAE